MATKAVKEVWLLSNKEIADAMQSIEAWLATQKIEDQNLIFLSLSLEEILLRWQDHFGMEQKVSVTMGSRLGQAYISLNLTGEACDPLQHPEEELDWSKQLLANLGLAPVYSYRRGINQVWLKLKRKKSSPLLQILCAAAAAALLGGVGLAIMPEQAAGIAALLLQPIRETLLGLLSAVAVPMIFLSVLLGVCGVGDVATFGKIGNRMISRFLGKSLLYVAVIEVISIPLFSLNMTGGSMGADQFSGALQMILDLLPGNMIEPFVTGNTLQIIVIAVAMGLACLLLGSQVDTVKRFAEEVNSVIYLLLEWVSALIPLIVFLILLETIWAGNAQSLTCIWKPLLITLAVCLILPAVELLLVCRRFKLSPVKLLRKVMPTLLITLATASSAAAYSTNLSCCENRLGIDRKITGFGIPLGVIAYAPPAAIYFLMCVFCGAEQYGTACSMVWFVVAWLSSTLLAIASPPIPGGSLACYAVLFSQMGIPSEAIVFALAMDAIVDRFSTTSIVAMLKMELLTLADKLELLDRDVLYADN